MKIEIDLEEVERLREGIKMRDLHVKSLEARIEQLNKQELERKAFELAKKIFQKFMNKVFTSLGFEDRGASWERCVEFPDDGMFNINKHWFEEHQKINVHIGANISDNYRTAFMRLGIDTNRFPGHEKNLLDDIE